MSVESKTRALLTHHLAEPMVEVLESVKADPSATTLDFMPNLRQKLSRNDWGSFVQVDMVPHDAVDRAIRLAGYAYTEARQLMKTGEEFIEAHPDDRVGSLNRVLKASRPAFMKVAELSDDEATQSSPKVSLFAVLRFPNAFRYESLFGRPMESPLRYKEDEVGELQLAWQPAVQHWLKINRADGGGCPALRYRIDHLVGERALLIDHFWDSLVDVEYPDN